MAKAVKAVIELGGKLDGSLASSMKAARGQVDSLTKSIGGIKGVANLAKSALAAFAAKELVDFAKQSVEVGKAFDSSMSQVAATMGVTVDEIGELRDFAKEMGAKTAFSATQAADALNYMALAGYDAQTSMDMLPNVLNLAAAGGMDLARASDMVTDASSALGLSLDQTTNLVDQMAKASSKSNTSVEQLGDAILTVGGTAKNLSGGVTEMSTALGILADNGVKGSEGGTALRNVILSLSAPTDTAATALASLGVSAFDAEGNMRPLNETFGDMGDALSQLTQEERTQALNSIFNKVDLKSVNALLANTTGNFDGIREAVAGAKDGMGDFAKVLSADGSVVADEFVMQLQDGVTSATKSTEQLKAELMDDWGIGAESAAAAIDAASKAVEANSSRWSELSGYIDDAQGAAQAMADTQLDNLEGDLTIFNSALEGVQINLSEGLSPMLRQVVQLGTDGLTAINGWLADTGAMQALGKATETVAGALRAAVGAVGDFADAFVGSLDLDALGEAFGGIGDVVGDSVGDGTSAIQSFASAVAGAVNRVVPLIAGFKDVVKIAVDMVKQYVIPTAKAIWEAVMPVIEGIADTISEHLPTIQAVFEGVFTALGSVTQAVWPAISSVVTTAVNVIFDVIKGLSGIVGTVSSIFGSVRDAIVNPIETAKSTIKGIVDAIKGFFSNFHISLPQIKLPHFAVKPPGWQIGDLLQGKIPTLGIEWYAKGGFTHGPIAIAGEAGPEAVISFDPRYRADNIGYWMQAGQMLGIVNMFASGGITTGEATPLSIDLASPSGSLALAAGSTGGSSVTVELGGVTFAPQVRVSEGDAGDVMSQIRAQRDEFLDMLDLFLEERGREYARVF